MGYWGGVICGCCASTLLFTVLMFTIIAQNNDLKQQVSELSNVVQEHELILNSDYLRGATEFYMWNREVEK